jgi:hypothetical protein
MLEIVKNFLGQDYLLSKSSVVFLGNMSVEDISAGLHPPFAF